MGQAAGWTRLRQLSRRRSVGRGPYGGGSLNAEWRFSEASCPQLQHTTHTPTLPHSHAPTLTHSHRQLLPFPAVGQPSSFPSPVRVLHTN